MVSSLVPSSGPRHSEGASGRRAAAATANRSTERSVPFTLNRPVANSMSASAASSSQAAIRTPFSTIWSDAFAITTAASRSARAECAPPPTTVTSVSPVTRRTSESSTPSHSTMSCAKLVACPWPDESVPSTTSIDPSGRTVMCARSRGNPVLSSM